jgi:hypothetical protein
MAHKQIRPIRVEGNIAYVTLSQGLDAIIDAADVHLVDRGVWCAFASGRKDGQKKLIYAQSQEGGRIARKRIAMHRLIMDAPPGYQVDHINGDTLDNRRSNLRLATPRQNQQNKSISILNTSGFKGVQWDQRRGKWFARIRIEGRTTFLGYFALKDDAAAAYAHASKKYHGEFGRVR